MWACAVAGHLALQRQGVVVRETVVGILKELERMPRFLKDLRPVAQRPGVSWLRRPQRSAVGAQVPTPSMAAHLDMVFGRAVNERRAVPGSQIVGVGASRRSMSGLPEVMQQKGGLCCASVERDLGA